ncbi:hypothetical protein NBC2815_02748 [Xanthomonas fragariae]|nr:hypothetical protein NBC2815_02748 [Xanthomonas fragariae]
MRKISRNSLLIGFSLSLICGCAHAQNAETTVPSAIVNNSPVAVALMYSYGRSVACYPIPRSNKAGQGVGGPDLVSNRSYKFVAMRTSNCSSGTGIAGLNAAVRTLRSPTIHIESHQITVSY